MYKMNIHVAFLSYIMYMLDEENWATDIAGHPNSEHRFPNPADAF